MMNTERLHELVIRLVASGPKAAHVSASECHEITDDVTALIEERDALALALTEALDWAIPTDKRRLELYHRGGCTSELIPQFTQIGERNRAERLAELAKLVAPSGDAA